MLPPVPSTVGAIMREYCRRGGAEAASMLVSFNLVCSRPTSFSGLFDNLASTAADPVLVPHEHLLSPEEVVGPVPVYITAKSCIGGQEFEGAI